MDTHTVRGPLVVEDPLSPFARSGAECLRRAQKVEELTPPLYVKRLVLTAVLPVRQNPGDAGYDLTSTEIVSLAPGERRLVSTGLAMTIPQGHYGRIAPRSGLAVKHGLGVGAGVIDNSFVGHVRVLLYNHGQEAVELPAGSRIAQLIIEKISTPPVVEVDDLTATERGAGGFGSTGL